MIDVEVMKRRLRHFGIGFSDNAEAVQRYNTIETGLKNNHICLLFVMGKIAQYGYGDSYWSGEIHDLPELEWRVVHNFVVQSYISINFNNGEEIGH